MEAKPWMSRAEQALEDDPHTLSVVPEGINGLLPPPETGVSVLTAPEEGQQAGPNCPPEAPIGLENQFRLLVEQAQVGMYVCQDERIVYVNPKCAEIFGYTPSEVYSLGFITHFIEDSDIGLVRSNLHQRLQGGIASFRYSFQGKRKDGRLIDVEVQSLTTELNGKPAVFGTLLDITESVKRDRALRENEERFRSLTERTSDWIWEVDTEWRYIYASPKLKDLLGYEPQEVLGKTPFDLMPAEEADRIRRELQGIMQSPKCFERLENINIRKDGNRVILESSGVPVFNAVGQLCGYRGIDRDITQRKQAEEALRGSETRFRELVDLLPQVVFEMDTEGILTFANQMAFASFGYTQTELDRGLNVLEVLIPTDCERAKNNIQEVLAGKKMPGLEFTALKKDGSTFPVLIYGSPILSDGRTVGVRGILVDMTERKRVEEALQESEAKYRSLYSSMSEGVALHEILYGKEGHPADYRVLDVNLAYESIFGLTKEQVVGRVGSSLHGKVPPPHLDIFERVARTGRPFSFQTSFEAQQKSFRVSVFSPAKGKFATVLEDISERLRLEMQLLQAQKLEVVGRLAGGIAHDFNNLLTVINCYSQLLAFQFDSDHPVRKDIEQIKKAGAQAAQLTSQLLAFSRRQVLNPEVLDLNEVVGNMEKMLRRLITENIELVTRLGARVGRVRADPTQLEQVIVNLVVNARDALPQGGRIALETADVEDGALPQKPVAISPGDYVMMSVSDNGCGMDEETRARIFEPFFTTKAQGKGTGLGLSSVYGIVKQSGGYIWVDSEEGKGTTFQVYLPRIRGAVEERKGESTEEQPAGGRETILLVEDDEGVRGLVVGILRDRGYTVLEAADATEALRITQRQNGPIDLLLTDVVMPKMSGRQLADHLAVPRPEMRVLYMSGYTDDTIVHHGILEPGIAYIQKPFTSESLLRKIRKVLEAPRRKTPVLIVDDDPSVSGGSL